MSEQTALLCNRVADTDGPILASVVDKCEWCGAAVWRALSSPKADAICCLRCIRTLDPNFKQRAVGPTGEQLRDIARMK